MLLFSLWFEWRLCYIKYNIKIFTVLSNSNDQSNTQDGEQQIDDDDLDQEIVATTSQAVKQPMQQVVADQLVLSLAELLVVCR